MGITQQVTMFAIGSNHKRSLQWIPTEGTRISNLNPRKTRPDGDVEALAIRIQRNGYEPTRAVWAHRVNGHYEVFAGGTRLLAAQRADLSEIPAIVYEDCDDAELVRLAEQDNADDEYHKPVPIVDTWLSYKALADAGWTQQRIADAKGVSRSFVAMRLQLAELPHAVLDAFVTNEDLNERVAREIVEMSPGDNLASWYSREEAMLDVLQRCLNKPKITAKIVAKEVEKTNAILTLAGEACEALDPEYQQEFVDRLSKAEARSLASVRAVTDRLTREVAEAKRREEEEARAAVDVAERVRIEAERAERELAEREKWMAENVTLWHGDFRKLADCLADDSVDMIFTDPPYDDGSVGLYADLAKIAGRVLKPNGSLICYAGHYALPELLASMTEHLRFWWVIALSQPNKHARLQGKGVFVHWKPLLWFVKGGRGKFTFDQYVRDLIESGDPGKDLHKWQQNTVEASYLIGQLTDQGNTLWDPMAGSGTTLIAGLECGCKVVGCEIEKAHVDTMSERIYGYYTEHRS